MAVCGDSCFRSATGNSLNASVARRANVQLKTTAWRVVRDSVYSVDWTSATEDYAVVVVMAAAAADRRQRRR